MTASPSPAEAGEGWGEGVGNEIAAIVLATAKPEAIQTACWIVTALWASR